MLIGIIIIIVLLLLYIYDVCDGVLIYIFVFLCCCGDSLSTIIVIINSRFKCINYYYYIMYTFLLFSFTHRANDFFMNDYDLLFN